MLEEFDYLFFPNIEIEYLFKNVSKDQWDNILHYFSLKYNKNKSNYYYVDTFYPNNIRHSILETIRKTKIHSLTYNINDYDVKCNISTEKKVYDFVQDDKQIISFRKKNKTVFTFKFYSLELSHIITNENKDLYEIELELNINKCRLETPLDLKLIIKKDIDAFIKNFLL